MDAFCTIITANYYPRALALYKSIRRFDPGLTLQVLVADDQPVSKPAFDQIKLVYAQDLRGYNLTEALYRRYAHINIDLFRWSMKSVFTSYLLDSGFSRILYVDCDMFFVNDFHFLFEELDQRSILLTPHWKSTDPLENEQSFLSLFTSGIFSAGFIGASRKGLPALQWWARACHFMMGPNINLGIHDDQKFLDIFPVLLEDSCILRHQGCNIGSWNFEVCQRKLVNGQVLINDRFPVIFIHFDKVLATEILKGHDPALLGYFEEYRRVFEEEGQNLGEFMDTLASHLEANKLIRLKWNLKIRTSLKKFFYKLAQSI